MNNEKPDENYKVNHLRSLDFVISQTTRSAELDETLSLILDEIMRLAGCDSGAIRLVDREKGVVPYSVTKGFKEEFYEKENMISLGECLCGQVGSGFRPEVLINDVTAVGNTEGLRWTCALEGYKSLLLLPIKTKGKIWGVLYLAGYEQNKFSSGLMDLLRIICNHTGLAIENAYLYAIEKGKSDKFTLLYEKTAEELAERVLELEKLYKELEILKQQLQKENISLKDELRTEHGFEEIVGKSRELHEVLNHIKNVAPTDTTVLIRGETGTGKELVARYIHELSLRKERVLVKVNCAALSEGLITSELFGHEKGAFTGAIERRIGRFEYADGATIFLDEIGDLPMETQAKLLRALQEGEFERVGNTKSLKVNVRVIASTNRDLEALIKEGRFRQDLFYRLNVYPIFVPPLRERKEDIPLLVSYFVNKYGPRLGKTITAIDPGTLKSMTNYDWPGNIRELENLIERFLITAGSKTISIPHHIFASNTLNTAVSEQTSLVEHDKTLIENTLKQTKGVIYGPKGAAKILGLKPTTLQSRIKKLGIKKFTS